MGDLWLRPGLLAALFSAVTSLSTHAATPQPPTVLCDSEDVSCVTGSDEPYDLSGVTRLGWNPVWPTEPNTTSTVSVSNIGQFQDAVRRSNVRITVAAGTYNGNLSVSGDDIDIVMSNNATLNGGVDMIRGNHRIRWTGGNVNTGTDRFTIRGEATDLMFDDFNIYGRFEQLGSGDIRRFAIINSTVDGDPMRLHNQDFPWLSSPTSGRYSDWIIANVRSETESGNAANRFQHQDRLLIVDSAFNMRGSQAAGLRIGQGSDQVHVENTLVRDRIFLSLNNDGSQQLSDGRFENVRRFAYSSIPQFATHFDGNRRATGVVNNSQMCSDMNVGEAMPLGPFTTETGNPPIARCPVLNADGYGARR